MSKVKINNLEHLKRVEEKEIVDYISTYKTLMHISLYGGSGVGKTEIVLSSLRSFHEHFSYSKYTVLHYDAAQIAENCTTDLFYSVLIYRLLEKATPNDINLTSITQANSFISYLEKSSYREEIKLNTKKALIASLSLLPTIGPLIYDLLKTTNDNNTNNYQTIPYVFQKYTTYLTNNTGLVIFIDNIQNIPFNIVTEFYELIRQSGEKIILFTSYTLDDGQPFTKKMIDKHRINNDTMVLKIENASLDMFRKICESNLNMDVFCTLQEQLQHFYMLVQYGNMREIDEFIFQIKQNGLTNLSDAPTLHGIRALNDVNKDIIDLASLFPEGIKLSFIKHILKYNEGCNDLQFKQSISNLCKMNYIRMGDNETLWVQHERIAKASKQNLEIDSEEERFIDLIQACKKFFSEAVYEMNDNSEFVFCVSGLIELEKELSLEKHLGILEKYINILYDSFKYHQICQLYNKLSSTTIHSSKIITLFPLRAVIQILDSFQKTSVFEDGLKISKELSNYYNMDLYKAKFLLQSYHYDEAIDVINGRLNNYESWSIYLNALQHLRRDDDVRQHVSCLLESMPKYNDEEYFYIILRNSGHLFEFDVAKRNLKKALEYFKSLANIFVEATCLNNMGILFLYQNTIFENLPIAKKHFKQAQRALHSLKSNEEYQPMINLGVCYFCEENYDMALEYFENATYTMPKSLLFDNIKLQCNILICKYLLQYQSKSDLRKNLLELYEQAEELPDPWIGLLCKYNLNVLRPNSNKWTEELKKTYPGEIDTYGLIVKHATNGDFMLGISPHWRY